MIGEEKIMNVSVGYETWQKQHIVHQDWELKKWNEIEIKLQTSAGRTPIV